MILNYADNYTISTPDTTIRNLLEYLHLSPFTFIHSVRQVITIILSLLIPVVTFHIAADVAATVLHF
jgi:hypothetical protein